MDLALCFTVQSNSGVDQEYSVGIKLNSRAHFWSTHNIPNIQPFSPWDQTRDGYPEPLGWGQCPQHPVLLSTLSTALHSGITTTFPGLQKLKESISLCFNLKILQGERAKATQQRQKPEGSQYWQFSLYNYLSYSEHYKHPH